MNNRILIIEDDMAIAEVERDYLQFNNFDVDVETDGSIGLQRALDEPYDLILLDVMLPHTDGYEICTRIRQKRNIPILMVSARKEEIDKIRGLGFGADDYITKPFSLAELAARVRAHLARYERLVTASPEDMEIVSVRGIKLDKNARRAWVNNEEVILTSKEFDILLFFIEHPNTVYSKDELFKEVWNMDAVGDNATVTVHIKRLREKIEINSNKPQYIETVWGVGYRFRV
ncbi:MAG: response regulator transcription factor [Lachnospiraceae bacterium]|nr:response regulator transcription factor [Lachnospiraceae bacterium]